MKVKKRRRGPKDAGEQGTLERARGTRGNDCAPYDSAIFGLLRRADRQNTQ